MGLLDKPIALDPGVGGLCIEPSMLQTADIIVSTTASPVSGVIRVGTDSVVSHAALYIGDGNVIEAIGAGVVRRPLTEALADDALAVAYRSPAMKPAIARAIVAFAQQQVGQPYSQIGAAVSPDILLCRLVGTRTIGFFCSQLVIEAYRRAGLPLTTLPAQCVTPDGIVEIAIERLVYVGHLKGNPSWFPVISP